MPIAIKIYEEILEGATTWYSLDTMFKERATYLKKLLIFTALYGLIGILGLIPQIPSWTGILYYTLANGILISVCCVKGSGRSIFNILMLSAARVAANEAGLAIYGVFSGSVERYPDNPILCMVLISIQRLLNFLLIYLVIIILKKNGVEDSRKESGGWIFTLIPLVCLFVSSMFGAVLDEGNIEGSHSVVLMIFLVFMTIITVAAAYFNKWYEAKEEEYYLLKIEKQKAENEVANAREWEAFRQELRIMMHDLHNHLQVMKGLMKEGKTEEAFSYIGRLEEISNRTPEKRYSSNPYLNQILTAFAKKCGEGRIKFGTDVRSEELKPFAPEEIVAVFGNLLENAYEAAVESADRYIDLRVIEDNAAVTVVCENSCGATPEEDESGKWMTSKEDQSKHGLGIKSVERILKRHKAEWSMRYEEETNAFIVLFRVGKG